MGRSSQQELQELSPAFYGLQTQETVRTAGLLSGPQVAQNVAQLEQLLKDIYCGRSVSAEFSYVEVSVRHFGTMLSFYCDYNFMY